MTYPLRTSSSVVLMAGASLLTLAIFAQSAHAAPATQMAAFDAIDANGDGYITSAEVKAYRERIFAIRDLDHDGVVSRDELETPAPNGAPAMDAEDAIGFLQVYDKNADGRVSHDEMLQGQKFMPYVDSLDLNGDHRLDRSEAERFLDITPHPELRPKDFLENHLSSALEPLLAPLRPIYDLAQPPVGAHLEFDHTSWPNAISAKLPAGFRMAVAEGAKGPLTEIARMTRNASSLPASENEIQGPIRLYASEQNAEISPAASLASFLAADNCLMITYRNLGGDIGMSSEVVAHCNRAVHRLSAWRVGTRNIVLDATLFHGALPEHPDDAFKRALLSRQDDYARLRQSLTFAKQDPGAVAGTWVRLAPAPGASHAASPALLLPEGYSELGRASQRLRVFQDHREGHRSLILFAKGDDRSVIEDALAGQGFEAGSSLAAPFWVPKDVDLKALHKAGQTFTMASATAKIAGESFDISLVAPGIGDDFRNVAAGIEAILVAKADLEAGKIAD